jgi:hypothetical protein
MNRSDFIALVGGAAAAATAMGKALGAFGLRKPDPRQRRLLVASNQRQGCCGMKRSRD